MLNFQGINSSLKTVFIICLPLLVICSREQIRNWGTPDVCVECYLEAIFALWSLESVSVLCPVLQCCYGYIFEEEIYDTHMVISSLLAKA